MLSCNSRTWLFFALVFLTVGCGRLQLKPLQREAEPSNQRPKPEPVAEDAAAGCSAAAANIESLPDACGMHPRTKTIEQACRDLNSKKDAAGEVIRTVDTDCLTRARDCTAVRRCD